MQDIITYINEGLPGALAKGFITVLKPLQKKFSLSEKTVNTLAEELASIQDELNNELNKLSKGKVKDATVWWKQLLNVKPEVKVAIPPEKVNNMLMTNIINASGVYTKAIKSWEDAKILDTPGLQYHIKRDIKQLIITIENICKDNTGESGISNQLTKIETLLSQIKLKDTAAKEILDETIGELSGKGKDFLSTYK